MRGRMLVKKICILGDPAVGKTSLVGRYVLQQFGEEYLSTIGARVCEKKVELEVGGTATTVELVIWDIAGQNQFTSVTPSFYRGAEGALIVCDPSRRETFRNLFRWDHQFRENAAAPNAVLLFNKSDIADGWEVTKEEAEALAGELGYPFNFTSARTGHNVEESFIILVRRMLEKEK
jgi:small GTP-binding protein